MAEAFPLGRSTPQMTESDMEAAQHLIQLSEDSSSVDNTASKRNRDEEEGEEEEQEILQIMSEITISNKMREIFGDHEVVSQPKKQRRYRSLVNIYMATTPMSILQR
ncbi:hypothetical protein Fmac_007357 [Flemingia macrophylla]|uniref:Uncharacterized protein n=1 Tax=Flemingia macrophylla TaxID=520843 RepID=A0ABD1MUC2_9FABA